MSTCREFTDSLESLALMTVRGKSTMIVIDVKVFDISFCLRRHSELECFKHEIDFIPGHGGTQARSEGTKASGKARFVVGVNPTIRICALAEAKEGCSEDIHQVLKLRGVHAHDVEDGLALAERAERGSIESVPVLFGMTSATFP